MEPNPELDIQIVEDGFDPMKYLKKIASEEETDDPFLVTDLTEIYKQWSLWRALCPRVRPYFLVRSSRSGPVLEVLAALGVGFTCSSAMEIDSVLKLGVDPGSIILGNTMKLTNHIKYAALRGVQMMAVDSTEEMTKVQRFHPCPKLILVLQGRKDGQIPEEESFLLKEAKELNLPVVGIILRMEGGSCRSAEVLAAASREAANWGYPLDILVLAPTEPSAVILREAADLVECLDSDKPVVTMLDDRLLVGSATMAAARVLATNQRSQDAFPNCFISDGMYGTFNLARRNYCPTLLGPAQTLDTPNHRTDESPQQVTKKMWQLWGPTCDSADDLAQCPLPPLWIGTWLVFKEMGAYSTSNCCSFNGYDPPAHHNIIQETPWKQLRSHLSLRTVKRACKLL